MAYYEITPKLLNAVKRALNWDIDDDADVTNVLNSVSVENPYPPIVTDPVNRPEFTMVPAEG